MRNATVAIKTSEGDVVLCVWFEVDHPEPDVGFNGAVYINRVSRLVGGRLIPQSADFRDLWEDEIADAVLDAMEEPHDEDDF